MVPNSNISLDICYYVNCILGKGVHMRKCTEPGCGTELTQAVEKYSTEKFHKPLCFKHQPGYKRPTSPNLPARDGPLEPMRSTTATANFPSNFAGGYQQSTPTKTVTPDRGERIETNQDINLAHELARYRIGQSSSLYKDENYEQTFKESYELIQKVNLWARNKK